MTRRTAEANGACVGTAGVPLISPGPDEREKIVGRVITRRVSVEQHVSARGSAHDRVCRFLRDESAVAITENELLLALVTLFALAQIGVVMTFGSSISSWFEARRGTITTL